MTPESIKKELIDLVSTLFENNGFDIDIIEYADLVDDLGMDSITFISLIVEIESLFNIQIPDDLLLMDNFKCADDIVSIIESELSKTSSGLEVKEDDKT